jgi:hypothetical protein
MSSSSIASEEEAFFMPRSPVEDGRRHRQSPPVLAGAAAPPVAATPLPQVKTPGEIHLGRYDPATMMRRDATVVVLGPRGSGKTVFMRYLMYCMRDKLDLSIVFCPTRDTREEYEEFIPKSHVYPVYSKVRLGSIYETQRKISAQMRSDMKKHGSGNGNSGLGGTLRNMGIILDDCMFDKEEVKGKAIRAIMMNGRHENLFFVNAVQYVVDFPKDLRSQVDVIVVFPLSGLYLKGAYEHMLNGAFDSFEECVAAFGALKEHECLVFDAKAKQKKQPYLFHCKATMDLPPFTMGADWVWRWYYKHMLRPENNAQRLREEMAMVLAVAKGDIEAPATTDRQKKQSAAGALADAHAGPTGIIVRRYPGPLEAEANLLAGPGPLTGKPGPSLTAAAVATGKKKALPHMAKRKPGVAKAPMLQRVSVI